jgi:membrane protein required for colicin V production
MESVQLSGYDFVVLGVFLLFIIRGLWLGLLKQIVPLLALYLGYFAASRYHGDLLPFLASYSDNGKVVFIGAYVILFVVTYVVAALLGKVVARVIQVTITPWFDRVLGSALGFAKALILVVIGHMIIGAVVAPENTMLLSCVTCPILNECADVTRDAIRDEDIREALRQQKPAIAIDSMKELLARKNGADSVRAKVEEPTEQKQQRPPDNQ